MQQKYDPGFEKVVEWDIPLLEGYPYEFLENVAKNKGSDHYSGIDNPSIIASVKKFEPDAILVYGWAFKSHLKVMRHFKGKVPVLFRGDSTLLDETSSLMATGRRLLLKWIYRHINVALYTGRNNHEYFRKAGLKNHQLVFAPHAVDNDRFQSLTDPDKKYADHLRGRFNILSNDFVVLFAGKMEPKKDPAILLEAFAQNRFPSDVHLVMTGTGVLLPALQEKYQDNSNIHFAGFQNQGQMPSVYQVADVFVLPSRGPSETWGLSVNEAMANGKAVIVSDKCGCAADLVSDGINGYVFKAGDLDKLIHILKQMADNKNCVVLMKAESAKKIIDYSMERVATAIETVLNRL